MSALKSKNSSSLHSDNKDDSKPKLSEPISESLSGTSLIGTVLKERYKVIRLLGSGGMGSVYLAEHVSTGKKFAIKVPFKKILGMVDFPVEAIASAKIGHKNIVDVLDGELSPDKQQFIVMEYLEGEPLDLFLENEKSVSWEIAKKILLQICDGLHAAHGHGVVHHDIKPQNIFLLKDGKDYTVKIVDFGIAKLADGRSGLPGHIGGTPEYSAPEQYNGTKSDHRADIYSLGVLMYEMLTGIIPSYKLIGEWEEHRRDPHGKAAPPFFTYGYSIDVPEGVLNVVERALKQDPDERFQSMTEMTAAIVKCTGDPGLSLIELPPPPSVKKYMPRHDAVSKNFIGGILISLGVISAAFLSWQMFSGGCKNNSPTPIHTRASPAKRVIIKPDSQPPKIDSGVKHIRKSKIKKHSKKKPFPASQPTIELSPVPTVKKHILDSESGQDSEDESDGKDEGDAETE